MAKQKTWKVIELGITPVDSIPLDCPHCGTEAWMPIGDTSGNPIIAANCLFVVFDRPVPKEQKSPLPVTVKCRYCRHQFTTKTLEEEQHELQRVG